LTSNEGFACGIPDWMSRIKPEPAVLVHLAGQRSPEAINYR
jgi:hypothetical protein